MNYSNLVFFFACWFFLSSIQGFSQNPQFQNYQTQQAPSFEPNKGQITDHEGNKLEAFEYVYQAPGMKMGLKKNGFSYNLYTTEKSGQKISEATGKPLNQSPKEKGAPKKVTYHYHRVEVEFKGANPDPEMIAQKQTDYYKNYYLGHFPEGITKVHGYRKLTYKNLYDNVDLVLTRKQNEEGQEQLKYDIVVHPGGELSDVKMAYKGMEDLNVKDGHLKITTSQGKMTETIPASYWAENQEAVDVNYQEDGNVIRFQAQQNQKGQTLVVDPSLCWSTFLGGNSQEKSRAIAKDSSGNVFLTGWNSSNNFPTTTGAYQTSFNGGRDAFLSKFSSSGSLIWSTLIGGGGIGVPINNDDAEGIATDGKGNVYITGKTNSKNFPTTNSAYQTSKGGGWDAFLSKFTSGGSLSWSTFLGGSQGGAGHNVATDNNGNAFVFGRTQSSNFPTTIGAYQTSYGGGFRGDAFLTKFTNGGSLSWSTFLGGKKTDNGHALSTDSSGNVYVIGNTKSTNFPTTSGAYQTSYGGGSDDIFISKFTSNGSLSWSTFLGGSNDDGDGLINQPHLDIALNDNNYVFVTGWTSSTNFPTTSGAHQASYGGGSDDAFLTKFTSGGSLKWSTFLGSKTNERGRGIATDGNGNVWITGFTDNSNFPTTNGAYQTSLAGNRDAFLSKFSNTGALINSTLLGGSDMDRGNGVAVIDSGNAFITGQTQSNNFPTTSKAYQNSYGSTYLDGDAFLTKFVNTSCLDTTINISVCDSFTAPSGSPTWQTSGTYYDTLTNAQGCDSVVAVNLVVDDGICDTTFGKSKSINSFNYSSRFEDIASGDIDGDGDLDLFPIKRYSVTSQRWYENDGNGSFTRHSLPLPTYANDLGKSSAIADIDNDGDKDLIVGVSDKLNVYGTWENVIWLENDGNQNFTTHRLPRTNAGTESIYVADLNGNGSLDIVSASNDSVFWYKNSTNSNPTFQVKLLTDSVKNPRDVHVSDIDEDGDMDVVVASKGSNEVIWFENNGKASPSFNKHVIYSNANGVESIHVQDLEGENEISFSTFSKYPDIISVGSKLMVHENNEKKSPSFSNRLVSNASFGGSPSIGVHSGDLDGDTDVDLVTTGPKLRWFENNGQNKFVKHKINNKSILAVTSGNFNNDYRKDVIVGEFADISFHKNTSQPPTSKFKWANGLGGSSNDAVNDIATDQFGSVYLTGSFKGTVDFNRGNQTANLTANGGKDIFIAKYDAYGNYKWAHKIGNNGKDLGSEIALDSNGNIVVHGEFSGKVDFNPDPNKAKNLNGGGGFLAKFSPYGNFKWAVKSNKGDISLNRNGKIFLAGNSKLSKYNWNGGSVWKKSLNGRIVDVDVNSNDVVLTGDFNGTTDFDPSSNSKSLTAQGNNDGFVIKFDSAGNFVWVKQISGKGNEFPTSVEIDKSGEIILTGYYKDSINFTPGDNNNNTYSALLENQKIFISKYEGNGSFKFGKRLKGRGSNYSFNISTDANNNILISGYFGANVDFDPTTYGVASSYLLNNSYFDLYLAKYDSTGKYLWNNVLEGESASSEMAVDEKNNIIFGGQFKGSNRDFNPTQNQSLLSSNGKKDVFFAKYAGQSSEDWDTVKSAMRIKNQGNVIAHQDTFVFDTLTQCGKDSLTDTFYIKNEGDTTLTIANVNQNPLTITGADSNAFSMVSQPKDTTIAPGDSTFVEVKFAPADSGSLVGKISIPNNDGYNDPYNLYFEGVHQKFGYLDTTVCQSYKVPSKDEVYTKSGTYYDTLTNAQGCDSILTINLTINQPTSSTINPKVCDSFTAPSGSPTWKTSGTYYDTLTNAQGCDSVVTVNLVVDVGIGEQPFDSLTKLSYGTRYADFEEIKAADIDADGDIDLFPAENFIVTNNYPQSWYENDGNGNFTEHTLPSPFIGKFVESCDIADVDGDGDLDLMTGAYARYASHVADSNVMWYENDGNQNFTPHALSRMQGGSYSVNGTDLDGDGDTDILSASSDTIFWYENNGNSNPGFNVNTLSGNVSNPRDIHVSDIDDDGDKDVVVASEGSDEVLWFENGGATNPTFTRHVVSSNAKNVKSVYVADLETPKLHTIGPNLNKRDIISVGSKVIWHQSDGQNNPSFTNHTISNSGGDDVFVTDLDGDSDKDIALDKKWFENNGKENFVKHSLKNSNSGAVTVTDVQNNNRPNIVTQGSVNGNNRIIWYKNEKPPHSDFKWANSIGGSNNDAVSDIATDQFGYVYLTGSFKGTVDFNPGSPTNTLTSIGGKDIFIAKYDANGNYEWAHRIGGNSKDKGGHIEFDSIGNLVVHGEFSGKVDFNPDKNKTKNLKGGGGFLAKFSPYGNFKWAKKTVKGNMGLQSSGNIYLNGQGKLQKYNSKGDSIWSKTISETGEDIAVGQNGNIVIIGNFSQTNDFDPSGNSYTLTARGGSNVQDGFVVKYDSVGNLKWGKKITGPNREYIQSLLLTSKQEIVITGGFRDSVDFTPNKKGGAYSPIFGHEAFVAKYNKNGNYLWSKVMDGIGSNWGSSISENQKGDLFISGQISVSLDFDPTTYGVASRFRLNGNSFDGFLSKYTSSGKYIWSNVFEMETGYFEVPLAVDGKSNILLGGRFQGSNRDFDPTNNQALLSSNGKNDVFFAKYAGQSSEDWDTVKSAMRVKNQGNVIAHQDTFVFDTLTQCGKDSLTDTFYIKNEGDTTLTLANVNQNPLIITGADSNAFSIISQPKNTTIAPSDSTFVAVKFAPSDTGFLTGNISISNNDGYNNPYNLYVHGVVQEFVKTDTSVCKAYTVPSGDETYTNSGSYNDTLKTSSGCDSLLKINLTVNNSTRSTFKRNVCDSFTFPSGRRTVKKSGIYYDTITNAAGCDSTLTMNVTVNSTGYDTFSTSACDSYTVPSGDETYTSSGTYHDTLTQSTGCDSILTVNLTIKQSTTASISPTACDSYTVPSGDETYTKGGTYKDTLTNAAGCDSVLTVNLTMNQSTSSTFARSVCDSFTFPSGRRTVKKSGIYYDTITNAAGCDSTLTMSVTVNSTGYDTFSTSACDSYTVPSGDETYTSSGTYHDTLTQSTGCDSILTVNLTIKNSTTASISPTACDSYTVPSGDETYTKGGTYKDTLTNAAGCDSVLTVNLTMNQSTSSTFARNVCDSFTFPSGRRTVKKSGIYYDTVTNAAGCDSTLTMNVTVNSTGYDTFSTSACDSYTVPSGDETYTSSGTYHDTLTQSTGCDSILTVNLTIKQSTTGSISPTACDSYTVPSGDETYTKGGTYKDTLTNAAGCDSVLTVNLTMNQSTSSTFARSVCDSFTFPSGRRTVKKSGIYYDTITNAAGCDSTLTMSVTVNSTGYDTFSTSACDSYTVPSGDETYTSSGTYHDTLTQSTGCDSILTVNLTIKNSTTASISPTACDSYTVPSGDETYTKGGTYKDTLTNAAGCDSVLTVNLTMNQSTSSTFARSVCDSFTFPSGGRTVKKSGIYYDTITNAAGCDSTLTMSVTVNSTGYDTFSTSACDSYTVPSGDETYTSSGTYHDTLTQSTGCDSILTVNLTIKNSTTASISPTACDSYTVPSGDETYTKGGTYKDTLTNAAGCDSVLTVNLTMNQSTSSTFARNVCDSFTFPSGRRTVKKSGIYYDTVTNAAGCDSTLTMNVTVNSTGYDTFNTSACDSYTVPSGDETYTSSGTYHDTLTQSTGCDSILTVNLTIKQSTTGSISPTACDSYTVPSGDETYTKGGTYKDTLTNAAGCDSVLTVNLTMNQSTSSTFARSVCDSFTFPSGRRTVKKSGIYYDTITNAAGCDSTLTMNVTVNSTGYDTFSTSACDSYTVPSGDETYTSSGTYHDTLTQSTGCDSILTVNLTIKNSTTASISPTACDSYTVPSGDETYTKGGTYKDTLTNAAGCDSVLTVNLTMNQSTSSTFARNVCDSFTFPSGRRTVKKSGIYYDTVTNAAGCDSTLTMNVTVNSTGYDTFSTSACDSYTVPSGDETYTSSGTYHDTLTQSTGCDSILTVNLTIKQSTTGSISPTACDSYTVPSGDETYTKGGTYKDTLTNAAGCDSVLTVNLTMNQSTSSTFARSVCDSFTFPSGRRTVMKSGIYYDTITNAAGCDSTLTMNVTVNSTGYDTFSTSACDSYTVPSGDETYTSSGTYHDTLTQSTGCDSILTVNLTIKNSTTASISPTACDSYTVPSGDETYTKGGTYKDTLTNAAGCDSVLTVNLTMNQSTSSTFARSVCDSFTFPSGRRTVKKSGIYYDTITNAAGCDSTLTMSVTVNSTGYDTFSTSACDSYTVPSGDETYTSSGTYHDTLTQSTGCDSILTVNLTIKNSTTASISPTACDSYTVPSGDETYTKGGTYKDTLTNAAGCDSVLTVNLTMNQSTSSTFARSVCDSFTFPSGRRTVKKSGIYYDTVTNAAGCDSTLTMNVTVNSTGYDTFNTSACDSYTVPSGDETYTSSGTYHDTLTQSTGCDSILTVNLTIKNSTTASTNVFRCDSYTVPSGEETYQRSGTYYDTLTNAAGCDSIVEINLTVRQSTRSTISRTVCDSFTYPSGSRTVQSSGTYYDTLINQQGCDSIIKMNVTVNETSYDTVTVNSCNSYTVPSGEETYTSSGTYQDTLTNSAGCDSILTIRLRINVKQGDTVSLSSCYRYEVPSGDETYRTSGMYRDTIPSTAGCDSILMINLTIKENRDTFRKRACRTYTVPSGDESYMSSGTYHDTLSNTTGCDSVLTIKLEINEPSSNSFLVETCDRYQLPSGRKTVDTSGIYQDTLKNAGGCDSVLTIYVDLEEIDTTVRQSGFILTANEPDASYQWLDCNDGYARVLGKTGRTLEAEANGKYAVKLLKGNCTDTSSCRKVQSVGRSGEAGAPAIEVYPNPTEGEYTISLGERYREVDVAVRDVSGKTVREDTYTDVREINGKLEGAAGMYFLEIRTNSGEVLNEKLIKQE